MKSARAVKKMVKNKTKNFCVPASLYRELENAAKSRGQTLTQYLDDLFEALIFGKVIDHED